MVQLVVGKKGKGKTKHLLDKVNIEVQNVSGNIVYLDKSGKHMYELNNKIRLIDVSAYTLNNSNEFIGFICGIISQDHDLQQMYVDNFTDIARIQDSEITEVITRLETISNKFGVEFMVSISVDKDELADSLKEKVIIAL